MRFEILSVIRRLDDRGGSCSVRHALITSTQQHPWALQSFLKEAIV